MTLAASMVHPDRSGFEQARVLQGRAVTCVGTLFGKWTEHHHTDLLMRGTCVDAHDGPHDVGQR